MYIHVAQNFKAPVGVSFDVRVGKGSMYPPRHDKMYAVYSNSLEFGVIKITIIDVASRVACDTTPALHSIMSTLKYRGCYISNYENDTSLFFRNHISPLLNYAILLHL